MTTPAERITAYLDARRRFPINTDQLAECKIGGQDWTYLTETDLRAVLADNERLTAQVAEVGFRLGETAAELADTRAKLAAASRALAAGDGAQLADRLTQHANALEHIRRSAWMHYLGDAFEPTHMHAIANLAAQALCGEPVEAPVSLEESRDRASELYDAIVWTDDEPAQPPAVAAPDAQDRARRAQEGLQRDSRARADAESGQGAAEAQEDSAGFCPECGTAQPLDHRDRITGHGAPDADCADWCGGSWNRPASAETTHQ